MSEISQIKQSDVPHSWLPYMVSGIGIALSIAIWYFLLEKLMLDWMKDSYPWMILIFGIFSAIIAGFAIRLAQLVVQRKKSLTRIHEQIQQEIAERLQAEESKQRLEKALLQGQKLQAIGTLAGGIAHDFNNILYAIIGYVEMTREDVSEDSLMHKNLGKVLEGCKRGQDLVARILMFSRRQQQDFRPVGIKETIEGVLGLLRPTIPASVTIQFQATSGGLILGNQTQLHQVIVNLINNAVDAMEGEGQVTIHLEEIAPTDKILRQFIKLTEGTYCKITVSDTGHGMDPHTMERIFEPFYTTKEVGKGTGLGLSTVHSIIKEHKGEILVESQLGHGTVFTLLLPKYQGEHNDTNTTG